MNWVADFEPTHDGRYVKWSVYDRDSEYSIVTREYGFTRTLGGARRKANRALRRLTRDRDRRDYLWREIDKLRGRMPG